MAPPCTFSSSPRSWRISRSRRTVMSETARSRASSATRTAPGLADPVQDQRLALAGKHRVVLRLRTGRVGRAARGPRSRRRHLRAGRSPKSTEPNMIHRANSRESLDIAEPARNNLVVAPGPPMRRGTGHGGGSLWLNSTAAQTVTRRTVLKGGVAVAALGGVSAFLAACGTSAAPRPRHPAPIARGERGRREPAGGHRHRHLRLELLGRRAQGGHAGRGRRLHQRRPASP